MRTAGIDHVAFYGTLMRRFPVQKRLGVADGLTFLGPCEIEGELRALSRFPGLLSPDSSDSAGPVAHGELYRVLRPGILAVLDGYEGYDPADEAGSLFVRRAVFLRRPAVAAWVYFLSERAASGAPVIASGVWNPGLG